MFKKSLCGLLSVVCMCACMCMSSCQSSYPGLHQPSTIGAITVEVVDFFGDSESFYMIIELSMQEDVDVSVYDGQIPTFILHGKAEDELTSYAYGFIGHNEQRHTQTYAICTSSPLKGKITLQACGYHSVRNPMYKIIEDIWYFSFHSKNINKTKETYEFDDDVLARIDVYEHTIICVPSPDHEIGQLQGSDVFLYDEKGDSMQPKANSFLEERYNTNMQYGFIYMEDTSEVAKIVIGERTYILEK